MTYRAPLSDMLAAMKDVVGLEAAFASGLYPDLSQELVEQVLEEAGKFAADRIAPMNRMADKAGATFKDGKVTTPPGWKDLYHDWAGAGWNGLASSPDFGGQGLPALVSAACNEIWNSASAAFGLGPILTQGAIEALSAHASADLQAIYLPKLVSGEWSGTMNLTEPQAGSDLSALRTRAERAGDGTYRITGQKIFITWGEQDITDNIIHLVLARLPDAPPGTRGISLFIVPKRMVNPDGTLGAPNDVRCHSIEHKLGIHASPTCTMVYGDGGGAVGYLVGEENRGLAAMFTMMNAARLAVGIQGVAIAERATQQAFHYAQDRTQGKAPGDQGEGMSPIIHHPDVKRMLMTMRAYTRASRILCFRTAAALDRYHLAPTEAERLRGHQEASLLTPIAKAFSTDIGIEVASLGVQVHGGMGFIEETGAAQHLRDARIYAIYEGTNGIQAIDLVTRKLPLDGGRTVAAEIAGLKTVVAEVAAINDPGFGAMAPRLAEAVEALDRATSYLMKAGPADALAGATPYLRIFGLASGGVGLAQIALAARKARLAGATDPAHADNIATARFFAENLATAAPGLATTVIEGAASLTDLALAG